MTDENAEGCIACGWTSKQQRQCCYSSHVKLIYGAHNRGVWSIGSDLILKERPDEGPKLEVKALSQLIAHKDIPVPKVLRDWVDDNHRYFILEERVDGQMLEEAWPFLSTSQKALIADQVAEVCNQLKNITSPSIQSVDQGPCIPGLLFFDLEPRCPFHSDKELWSAIALTLHDPPRRQFPLKARET